MAGHSFGGKTALRAAYLDKRIKAALTFDPWMYTHMKEVFDGKFKIDIPHCAVNTTAYERLSTFDTYGAI